MTLFLIGLAISVGMVARSLVGGDQIRLLVLGWEVFANGTVPPYGVGMSEGGLLPGSLSGLLVGLPLFLWDDYRSAGAFTVVCHVVAWFLIDRTFRGVFSRQERILFCVLYWLNPWRMYFSAHVWNPNWIVLFSAIHMCTAFRQRTKPSFLGSFLHVFSIGLAFQVHGSFLILAILSVFLFARGYMKVNWIGVACGVVLTLLSLLPWILAALENSVILPVHDEFIGRNLVYVLPTLRGALYLLRMPSMHFSSKMTSYDFAPALGETADDVLQPVFWVISIVIGSATVVAVAIAQLWFWRQDREIALKRLPPEGTDRQWLRGSVRFGLVSAIIAFALSPTTILAYYLLVVIHVTVLPVVLWLGWLLERREPPWVERGVTIHRWLLVTVAVAMMLASPMYRMGTSEPLKLQEEHPVIKGLHIDEREDVVVDPEGLSLDPMNWALTSEERLERRGRE